jgi:hypothetical protein
MATGTTRSLVHISAPSSVTTASPGIVLDIPITGLTGGGAGNLDGIVTVGTAGPIGSKIGVQIGTDFFVYELRASDASESVPTRIRPDDFNISTNPKVWFQLPPEIVGYYFTANGDPGTPFDVEGRGRLIHGLTMQGGSQNFTNGADHFHLLWTQQGNRGWQMTMGGDNAAVNNRLMLCSLSIPIAANLYNEANAHSIDTTGVTVGSGPVYRATGVKLRYTSNPALLIGTPVQLAIFPGIAGITAATYSGNITQAPTLVGGVYETLVELDNFNPANWNPAQAANQPVFINTNGANCFRLNVYLGAIAGTRVSLTGNYENIPFQVLVEQTGHDAFKGASIVLQVTATIIGLSSGFYDGYVDRVIDANRYVLRLGSMIHTGTIYPTTSGTAGSTNWIIVRGNQDPVHRMLASLQAFMFERKPSGNSSELTNNRIFRYGVGPNCIGFAEDAAAVGFDIVNSTPSSVELGAENSRKLRVSRQELKLLAGLSFNTETAARQVHDAVSVAIASNTLVLPGDANIVYATGSGPINQITNAAGVSWLINNTGANLTLTNSATLRCRGGADIILGVEQSCTVVAGAGFVSIH